MATILLLEPKQVLASQYKQALQNAGHTVKTFSDAQAAIIAADIEPPDLIITELLLAKHSGIEFLYELRSYSEWRHIPVIILSRITPQDTGLSEPQIRELGIGAVLYKPETSLERLVVHANRLLAKASMGKL